MAKIVTAIRRGLRMFAGVRNAAATRLYHSRSLVCVLKSLILVVLALPSTSLGHRLDEYLQATLVTIEPGQVRLQINLTPGVEVAEHLLTLIDRDHNGVISSNEATAYCESLKRDLIVRLDKRKVALRLAGSNFPAPSELRTGWGIIQIELTASIGPLAAGMHRLTVDNRHLPTLSVYLFNAAQPTSGSVHIGRQKRNQTQSTGEIEFGIAQPDKSKQPARQPF